MIKKFFGELKKRDIVVALITILAIAALFVLIKMSKRQEKNIQEELVENGTETVEVEKAEDIIAINVDNRLVINEVSSSGKVELYNNSNKAIDISDYVVVTGEKNTVIEKNTKIEAKSLYVVETWYDYSEGDNNVVRLNNAAGESERAIYFDKLAKDTSYGCLTDGSYEAGYIKSSIGSSNDGCEKVARDELVFSVPSGFYNNSFELEISAPEGCKVYYTLDGTTPTVDSKEYSSKIGISRPNGKDYVYAVSDGNDYTYITFAPEKIDMGVVVNAIAVKNNEILYSKTSSYFIGFGNDSDYAGLPVVSIEVDPADMFGFDHGIYVPGKSYYTGFVQKDESYANYLDGLKAEAQVEFFEPCKDKTFSSKVNISIYNDGHRAAAQKSFEIKTSEVYPRYTSLDKYLNRSSNAMHLLSNGGTASAKIRPLLVNGLVENTSVITVDYQPCIVFINGEYWGEYALATNFDSKYFKDNLGITEDVVAVTSDYRIPQEYTDFYNYVVSTDFSDPANYEQLKTMMDVDNYIEYMCTNIFIANSYSYVYDNAVVFKTLSQGTGDYSDGKWRWALNNVDNCIANPKSFLDAYSSGDYSTDVMNTYLTPGIRDSAFFASLLKSDSFCKAFTDKMNDLSENEFTSDHASQILDNISGTIGDALVTTLQRYTTNDEKFLKSEIVRLNSFFKKRSQYISAYTEEYISLKGDVPGKKNATDASTEEGSVEDDGVN